MSLTPSPFQPYVTELDLRHSLIPDEVVEDLLSSMPTHRGPDLQEDRNLPKYDYISFMDKMMGPASADADAGGGDGAHDDDRNGYEDIRNGVAGVSLQGSGNGVSSRGTSSRGSDKSGAGSSSGLGLGGARVNGSSS